MTDCFICGRDIPKGQVYYWFESKAAHRRCLKALGEAIRDAMEEKP